MKRAIISVYNKKNIEILASALINAGYGIISTGNTARYLKEHGIDVIEVSDYTGFPEILDGRVKTLHPKIHAGILANRKDDSHRMTLHALDIDWIDVVVVNLYPFEENPSIEMIDIGGPTLIRAAAKNYENMIVITDPDDYVWAANKFNNNEEFTLEERKELAKKAFILTALYDAAIYNWFESQDFPSIKLIRLYNAKQLRYGENPHQKGFYYTYENIGFSDFIKYQGKELSFNNIADADAAYKAVLEFDEPACVIVKHATPCGAAVGLDLKEAFIKAFSSDPISAYGGIVAFNSKVNADVAMEVIKSFFEVIIAPDYDQDALNIFENKKNLRILKIKKWGSTNREIIRSVVGGFLVQDEDTQLYSKLKVVTKRHPTESEMSELIFAFKVVKHVKSNAIVLSKDKKVIGIGSGQTSRVDAVKIAIMKAEQVKHNTYGAVMASDAFFPFPDSIEEARKAGVTAIIQPGGSVRDEEVIKRANELDIAMVFTEIRHFRH